MKKTIALLLAAILLAGSLTSCELFISGEQDRLSPQPPTGGPGEEPPDDSDDADPTVDEYGFTLFPEGNYLADPRFDTEEFLPDYDADPSFIHFLSTAINYLCVTDTTIYSYIKPSASQPISRILYTDKETGITLPLCGKPECRHNDENCNAYIANPHGMFGMSIYDGKLCWFNASANSIYSATLDGANRETLCKTPTDFVTYASSPCCLFHRGYYYFSTPVNIVSDGIPSVSLEIKVQALDGSESFFLLDKTTEASDNMSANILLYPYGNDLYILVVYTLFGEEAWTYSSILELYRWDSKTRKGEQLLSTTVDEGDEEFLSSRSFGCVPGDGLYYTVSRELSRTDSGNYLWRTMVMKYSLETGETQVVFQLDDDEETQVSGDFYYVRDRILVEINRREADGSLKHILNLYSYDGELQGSLDMGDLSLGTFSGADQEYLYSWYSGNTGDFYFALPLDGGDPIIINAIEQE